MSWGQKWTVTNNSIKEQGHKNKTKAIWECRYPRKTTIGLHNMAHPWMIKVASYVFNNTQVATESSCRSWYSILKIRATEKHVRLRQLRDVTTILIVLDSIEETYKIHVDQLKPGGRQGLAKWTLQKDHCHWITVYNSWRGPKRESNSAPPWNHKFENHLWKNYVIGKAMKFIAPKTDSSIKFPSFTNSCTWKIPLSALLIPFRLTNNHR